MDYISYILNSLLDKYEDSNHFKGNSQSNRRVILKFNERDFPYYDIEDATVKGEIHYSLERLKEKGLIEYDWIKQQEGNIVDKAYLVLNKIGDSFKEVSRKPKQDALAELLEDIISTKREISIPWILNYLDYCESEITLKKHPKYMPKEAEKQKLIFATLKGIEKNGNEEILERIFSRRYLNNSKSFEREVRTRLVNIIKDFLLNGEDLGDEENSQEAILQQVGLIKTSEELLFFGALTIHLEGNIIDYKPYVYGSAMNTKTIKNFAVSEIAFRKVLTIENKASFINYLIKAPKNELVVYLGGFYSPTKRIFLEKIYKYITVHNLPVEFYHWGDIDLGGFQIFNSLREKVIGNIRPIYMNVETLHRFLDSSDKINDTYKTKLGVLLENDSYSMFHEVIREMLEKGVKLEQEAYES